MSPDPARSSPSSIAWAILAFAVVFFLFLGRMGPLTPEPMSGTLDDSWAQASVYALVKGLRFGDEFVFTSGPLSPIFTHLYSGPWLPFIAALATAIAAFLAFGFSQITLIAAKSGGWLAVTMAIVALAVIAQSVLFRDSLLMAVPVMTAVLYADRRARTALVLIGTVLSAVVALAKFSVLVLVFGCVVVMDVLSLFRREIPYKTVALAVVMQLLWMLVGQDWGGLPAFMVASLEVTAGYGDAMSLDGPWYDLALWLFASAALLVLLAMGEFRAVRAGETDGTSAIARLILYLGFVAVLLKAGFVRHDLHDVIAWSGLGIAAFTFYRPHSRGAVRTVLAPTRVVGLASGFLALGAGSLFYGPGIVSPLPLLETSAAQFREAMVWAASPNGWLAEQAARADAAEKAVTEQFPVPALDGTVDILDSRQSSLIAAGLDYRPRPTVQEYTTYSPRLTARNRAFFESASAPAWLLFGFYPIDDRHVASSEGALWPLFLERYETLEGDGDHLVLKRRAAALPSVLGPPTELETQIGAEVLLPDGDTPLFAKVDIRKSLAGSLMSALFRAPLVFLVLGYPDGSEERFRLIPGQIRDGMVITPRVAVPNDYLAIERGQTAGMRRPSRFRIETGMLGGMAYQPSIAVSLQEIRMPAAP